MDVLELLARLVSGTDRHTALVPPHPGRTLYSTSSSGGSIPTTPTAWSAGAGGAIRKAITAHMAALGYGPRAGEGAHRIVLGYARHRLDGVLTADQINDADARRRDR